MEQLPGTARVYDAAPVSLGDGGLLGAAVAEHQPLMNAAREAAIADTTGLVKNRQAVEAEHLGDDLPGTYNDYLAAADEVRRQDVAPLYGASDKIPVDLTAHPDLLNHYILGNDFARFLSKDMYASGVSPGNSAEADRFLVDRAQAVSAAREAVKGLDRRQVGLDAYDSSYTKALLDHAADNNLDLSIPRPLIIRYVDDLNANRPDYTKQITKLAPNPVNDATRVADMTSRAMQEISPEYADAQQMYAKRSLPKNRAALAQTVFKSGTKNTKLGEQVTDDFIERNRDYAQRAIDAGLDDDMKPLTRHVLNEKILNDSNGDPTLIPSSILKNIDHNVRPRFEDIYGIKPVDAWIRDTTERAELHDNRRGLVNKGLATGGGDIKPSTVMRHGFMAAADHVYRSIVHWNTDKRMAEFLQLHPEKAIAHIEEYMLKHPEGKLPDYEKYLNSVLGSYVGGGEHPEVAADPVHSLKWDYDQPTNGG